MDIISIGDINIDIITPVLDDMPERDRQRVIKDISMDVGGCSANFAYAASKLGADVRFIGKLGDDIFRDFILERMQGVDMHVPSETKTGITYAITFEDGTRSFITYPGSNAELSIEDINFDLIEGRYVHVASFFLQGLKKDTVNIFRNAHEKEMITSFDTGWDPFGWSSEDIKVIKEVLREGDIFFPNLDEAKKITKLDNKDEICDALLDSGPEIIGLKMGSNGSYIASQDERLFIPPFEVTPVDTTGAGDVFNAAFIFGHHKGWDLERIGRFANTAAGLSVCGAGRENYPGLGEVVKFI